MLLAACQADFLSINLVLWPGSASVRLDLLVPICAVIRWIYRTDVLLWNLAVFWNLYYIGFILSNCANDFIMTHLLQNLIQFIVKL